MSVYQPKVVSTIGNNILKAARPTGTLKNKYHRLVEKVRLLAADIAYLQKCKKLGVFPKFLHVNCSVATRNAEKAILAAKQKWLQLEIKTLYSKRSSLELQTYQLHQELTYRLDNFEYENFLSFHNKVHTVTDYKLKTKNQKLARKLTNLGPRRKTKITPTIFSDQVLVKNLSSETFTAKETAVLQKGTNFTIPPLKTPTTDIVAEIETAIKHRDQNEKSQIRRNCLPLLKTQTRISPETKDLYDVITDLKAKDVIYTKADKGNTLVILDKAEYEHRVEHLLRTGPYFRRLTPLTR